MSNLDFHAIVERFHTYQNPTSEGKLDRLIDYCGIEDGQNVLDIGCGKAWLLRRMNATFKISGVGVEIRETFLKEAQEHISAEAGRGDITLHQMPAGDFSADSHSFDVGMCIGASFAIGTFEEMISWLQPFIKPGGVMAVGDIYARYLPVPAESAVHFSGGSHRTLKDTAEFLNRDGRTLTGLIDSSLDDWDNYESLHWRAADLWARENPNHPGRDQFIERSEGFKLDHIRFDREALGWALFICRVP